MTECANCGAPPDAENLLAPCAFCGAVRRRDARLLARSLCIETAGDEATVLVPRGSELPASVAEVFSTAEDGQSAVAIHLVEGDDEKASRNRNVGNFQLTGLRPQPRKVPQIQFVLRISAGGELEIEAEELGTENRRTYKGLVLGVE
jgi:molecular chaperone DnaK (HSP70)